MISSLFSRRDFTLQLLLLLPVNAARKAFAAAHVPGPAEEQQNSDVSHACESIHQEVTFIAGRKRVYEALTDQKQFNRVVQLSAAGMSLGNAATEISPAVGGVFTLFGGHIIGRHIELVPEERVVQAWRVVD